MRISLLIFVILVLLTSIYVVHAQELTVSADYYPRAGIVCSKYRLVVADVKPDITRKDTFKSSISLPKDVTFKSTSYFTSFSTQNAWVKDYSHKSFTKSFHVTIPTQYAGEFSGLTCHYGKPYKESLDKLNELTFTDSYQIDGHKNPVTTVTNAKVIPDSQVFLASSDVQYTVKSKKDSYHHIVFDLTVKDTFAIKDYISLEIAALGRESFGGKMQNVLINKKEYTAELRANYVTIDLTSNKDPLTGSKFTIEFPDGHIIGSIDDFNPFQIIAVDTNGVEKTDFFYTGGKTSSGTSAATVFIIILLIIVLIAAAFFLFRCVIAKRCQKKQRSDSADSGSDVYDLLA